MYQKGDLLWYITWANLVELRHEPIIATKSLMGSLSLSKKSHYGATSYLHMHLTPLPISMGFFNISRIDKGNSHLIYF